MEYTWIVLIFFYLAPLIMGYFIGSIPFGLLLTKLFIKQDIREIGSGNIGATNVLRTGNKKLAALTLLLDTSKGVFAIIITYGLSYVMYNKPMGDILTSNEIKNMAYDIDQWYLVTVGIFAILGHCFPIWLKFKGGKGVATSLGVLLAAVPLAGLAACGAWIIAAFAFRVSSLAALIAALVASMVTLFIYGQEPAFICALITLLIFIRHKENIKRIIAGTEPKIGKKKKEKKDAV